MRGAFMTRGLDAEGERELTGSEIAVIGMAGRFPDAPDLTAFWDNLCRGVESIRRFSADELEPSPVLPPMMREHPDFVPAGAVLDPALVDAMDHDLFGLSRREAQWTDPQQRVMLECAFAALDDAGYDAARFPGKMAFYGGVGQSGHQLLLLEHARREPAALFEALGTASAENAAMRVSYKLKLRGESMTVYTACSTGLVVVHMACQSLLLRQADIALAGAVKIAVPQRTGYLHQEGMIFSPDGRCRPFDHRAGGTVTGNGAGVVVLKPLADALRDGDRVYAVVLGSALNNDADLKVGYTAPSVAGQADAIGQALAYAGVEADTIGLVEAHGTGTSLGDPIEIAALSQVFRRATPETGFCALGSVKANIGHLDTAAGMAGFIKAALAVHHGQLPPSITFERPGPAIDLDKSPFFINTELLPWPQRHAPRRAGVSSFGIGGTNAHAVLEQAPPLPAGEPSRRTRQVVTLSARTAPALDAMARELADHIAAHDHIDIADVAFTRNIGRRAFGHRRALVVADRADLIAQLRGGAPRWSTGEAGRPRRVAMLFPGQGAQSAGMAAELYEAEPVFRREIDRCAELVQPTLGIDLRDLLRKDAPPEALSGPAAALPCLLATEHALDALWSSWGVVGEASLGHSFGEYAAACRAGVLALEDALRLAVVRGRLMEGMPPGAMLAVGLAEAQLAALLPPELSIAAVNAAERCTVSGPVGAIDELERALSQRRVAAMRLPSRHAFHSRDVDGLVPHLVAAVRGIELRPPQRPLVSSLTGTWMRDQDATSPEYWGRQMREPVRFAAGLDTLAAAGFALFVEAGPDQALSSLVQAQLRGGGTAAPSLRRAGTRGSDGAVLLRSLAEMWIAGQEIDWAAHHAIERRRRVALPGYPFERRPLPPLGAAAERTDRRAEGAASVTDRIADGSGPIEVGENAQSSATVHAASLSPRDGASLSPGDVALGEIEERIAAVWRDRLGVDDVGRHDNFLEVGGNSLMAAQVLTRLREMFPVNIPLADLFEAPTVAGIAARIDERLRGRQTSQDREEPMTRLPRGGPLPISVVQARVLAIAAREPDNPSLHMPVVIAMRGELRTDVLQRALAEVVRRHEILRTTYAWSAGGVVARADAHVDVTLDVTDLRRHPAAREHALELAREEAARPFDLGRAVLRAGLLRLADDEHWLALTVHHVACDTWSLLALVRELSAAYISFAADLASPLPDLALQYADFAGWQERQLRTDGFAAQRAWWTEQIGAPPAPLDLPTDRAGSSGAYRGGRALFRFSRPLSDAVHAFGEAHAATPFMTVLAAYTALLARHSGQEDVMVGTPIGNRTRPELEPLIGYVAHSVALRTDVSGDPSFAELVARVRRTTLDAYANPDVPYEALIDDGEAAQARLFDAVFVLQGAFTAPALPGLTLELVEVPGAPAQWGATLAHLSISMGEDALGFYGALEYDADRFDADTAERLIGRLQMLLDSGLRRPGARMSALDIATEEERRALPRPRPIARGRGLSLSLSFFANDEDSLGGAKYALLTEGARFADRHGFAAVWTPERHFHPFGGLYPAPSVVGAGLATITERIHIRAGSVVLPLHDPIRVAEEWSVLDNLSGGRAGVSVASGWHANDFVFAPDSYAARKQVMLEGIETLRALWRGEAVTRRSGSGKEVEVRLRPRPVQAELPIWLTAAGSPDTFRAAGELGAGVLTNLMGQDLDGLGDKIALYRRAWADAGHPGRGQVTLMMHAFLGDDVEDVRRTVREPLQRYFRSSVDIFGAFAASQGLKLDVKQLSEADIQALVEHGFDRYFETAGVFGTADSCAPVLGRVHALDVDEVACLIDFGVELDLTLDSLAHLAAVGEKWRRPGAAVAGLAESAASDEIDAAGDAVIVDGAGRPLPWGVVGRLVATGQRARTRRDGTIELMAAPVPRSRRTARTPQSIQRAPRDRDLPLSFAQQRLWYLDQLEPGNAAYNNPVALRLSGPLDTAALERAINEVVSRHEVLRTRIAVVDGRAAQQILPDVHVPLEVADLSGLPETEREDEARRRARAEAGRPFALDTAPLVRAALLRLSPDHQAAEHILLVTMHHIVSDGWSAGVLFAELGALYAAFAAGKPSPLPELAVQYADHAVWQRQQLDGPLLAGELAYWKERLADLPALELAGDRPRPPVPSSGGARQATTIAAPVAGALAALARDEGATPFMGLLAALQAVLHRYTAQTDFGVGTPVAGRNRPEVEPLVGCFVNTLVLRADLSERPSFRELVRRVRRDALGAFAHQELPFERLVDALEVPRDLSVPALFQVMLVLHNTPVARAQLEGLRLEGMEVDSGKAKFDLTLELREGGGGFSGSFEYSTDLFDAATVEQLARHFEALVAAAVAEPERPIDDLPLLSAAEERQLLVEWNDTAAPYSADRCLHQLFAAQAARTPDALAVVSPHEDAALTYADLDARAGALASALADLGVGPEDRVGLLIERSATLVVGILGALEAGATYVPLDPGHPVRPAGPPARRRAHSRSADPPRAARPRARLRRAGTVRRGLAGHRRAARRDRGPPGLGRLRDVHIRLDRPAQGRGGAASGGRPHDRGARLGPPRSGRRRADAGRDRVRRLQPRAVERAPDRRARRRISARPALARRAGRVPAPPPHHARHAQRRGLPPDGRPAPGGSGRPAEPHGGRRRAVAGARAPRARAVSRPPPAQRLRADRGRHHRDRAPGRAGRRARLHPDRQADRQHARAGPRPPHAAGAGRRARRAVRGRRRAGPRLSGRSAAHRRRLRAGSVRPGRRAPVPDR